MTRGKKGEVSTLATQQESKFDLLQSGNVISYYITSIMIVYY